MPCFEPKVYRCRNSTATPWPEASATATIIVPATLRIRFSSADPLVRLPAMILSMAGQVTTLLACRVIVVPDIRPRLGYDPGIEIHHGPIGPRISADHAVRIVA